MATSDTTYYPTGPTTTYPSSYTYSAPVEDYTFIQVKKIVAALEAKAITRKEAREALKALGSPFAAIL